MRTMVDQIIYDEAGFCNPQACLGNTLFGSAVKPRSKGTRLKGLLHSRDNSPESALRAHTLQQSDAKNLAV